MDKLGQQLEHLRERNITYGDIRKKHALEVMPESSRKVLQLIPILFHYNDPVLPGYVSGDVPAGINHFSPDAYQIHYIESLCHVTSRDIDLEQSKGQIFGLYSMGSTGSLGQTKDSDLDIWICHSHLLPDEQLNLLTRKCDQISRWAERHGTEVSFFLIPDNKFTEPADANMSQENCGSTQHFLLLDEFYRSALRLAGRVILWQCLPDGSPETYYTQVNSLRQMELFEEEQWLDLGPLPQIPAAEYFGAGLWQLYKGIDSPFKSVLKALLLESYASKYPNTLLLAQRRKTGFINQDHYGLESDPYYLMLEAVTEHLAELQDWDRLQLARECFYLKTGLRLSQPAADGEVLWRRTLMQRVTEKWGWDQSRLAHLDNMNNWKVKSVKEAYNSLLAAMMSTYKNLIRFARRNNIRDAVRPEEIGILSRKLYAAYESLPGKVSMINPKISPNLGEPELSLIQVPSGHNQPYGWYLYTSSLMPGSIIGQSPVEHSSSLNKLVAWSYFNGLIQPSTNLHLYNQSSDVSTSVLKRFIGDLRANFTPEGSKIAQEALNRPCEIVQLAVFLNLENDPSLHWRGSEIAPDSDDDILSFGEHRECLIGSIDILYRNSWNEVRTMSFDGEAGVAEALSAVMGKMHQEAQRPASIKVFTYSQYLSGLISNRFQKLLEECIDNRLGQLSNTANILTIGQNTYGIFYERRGALVRKLESAMDFYTQLSHSKMEQMPVATTIAPVHWPVHQLVEAYAAEGLMQFFFEDYGPGFNIFIADEQNHIELYQHTQGGMDKVIQGLSRFYTGNHEDDDGAINFNLPQFYLVVIKDGQRVIEPYRSDLPNTDSQVMLGTT